MTMLCFRIHRRFPTYLFTNKEKIFHLVCACIFLYLIKDLQNFKRCHTEVLNTAQNTPKSYQNPPKLKVPLEQINKKEAQRVIKNNNQIIKKKDSGKVHYALWRE